jgi:hypothetical protein
MGTSNLTIFYFYFRKGHFVPSKASWRTFLKAYMLNPTGNIPSPGLSSASQPGSGAVTPLAG